MNIKNLSNQQPFKSNFIGDFFSKSPAIFSVFEIELDLCEINYLILNLASKRIFDYPNSNISNLDMFDLMEENVDSNSKNSNWIRFNYKICKQNTNPIFLKSIGRIQTIADKQYYFNIVQEFKILKKSSIYIKNQANEFNKKLQDMEKNYLLYNEPKFVNLVNLKTILVEANEKNLINFIESEEVTNNYGTNNESSEKNLSNQIKNNSNNEITNLAYKFPTLSKREIEVCKYIINLKSTKQISSFMNISPKTIDLRRYYIRKKLGLSSTQDLTLHLIQKLNEY